MRAFLLLALLSAIATARAESVVLTNPAHTISLIYDRETKGDQLVITETWSIGRNSRIVKTIYGKGGVPLSRLVSTASGRSASSTEAVINSHGAVVTVGGSDRSATIPLMKSRTIADPSIDWFAVTKPEQGATGTFMSFDPEFRYWEEVTVSFDGRDHIGSSAEGNLVTRRSARKVIHVLFDDKGIPLVWQDGKFTISRK